MDLLSGCLVQLQAIRLKNVIRIHVTIENDAGVRDASLYLTPGIQAESITVQHFLSIK